MMDKISENLIEARFLIRTLEEHIYSGQANSKEVREVRKKVNSLLKDLMVLIKD